jgi:hypothetical protein
LCIGATPLYGQRCDGRLEDLEKHKQADSGLITKGDGLAMSSVRPDGGPFPYGKYFWGECEKREWTDGVDAVLPGELVSERLK